jgi:hypothetical protein
MLFDSATGEAGTGRRADRYSPPRDGFAEANLIQAPSRIKRASRHVPFINILDQ